MPTYTAIGHPDCTITCSGNGGATFIPPYRCHTWCADDTPAVRAFVDEAARSGSHEFESTLVGVVSAGGLNHIASALLELLKAPPQELRDDLRAIVTMTSKPHTPHFILAWYRLVLPRAMKVVRWQIEPRNAPQS